MEHRFPGTSVRVGRSTTTIQSTTNRYRQDHTALTIMMAPGTPRSAQTVRINFLLA